MHAWGAGRCAGLLLTVTLSGCLGSNVPGDSSSATGAAVTLTFERPTSYVYECPAGASSASAEDGPCIAGLAPTFHTLEEPFLAIDPRRPQVWAIGANSRGNAAPDTASPLEGGLGIYLSEDAGRTWRSSRLTGFEEGSRPPFTGDPALAFDATGVLHLTAMANGESGWTIVHARSSDLGRSWSPMKILSQERGVDRNWIGVAPDGTIVATWQRVAEYSAVAWTRDGGATWRELPEASRPKDCGTTSPPEFWNGRILIACRHTVDHKADGIRVYEIRPAEGTAPLFGHLPDLRGVWPRVHADPAGGLAVVIQGHAGPELSWSADGVQWSPRRDLMLGSEVVGGWKDGDLKWSAVDPHGGLHLLVEGPQEPTGPMMMPETILVAPSGPIVHLVVDPTTGALVSERLLSPADRPVPSRLPPTLNMEAADHFHSIAFSEGRTVLLWTDEKGLEYTTVRPA